MHKRSAIPHLISSCPVQLSRILLTGFTLSSSAVLPSCLHLPVESTCLILPCIVLHCLVLSCLVLLLSWSSCLFVLACRVTLLECLFAFLLQNDTLVVHGCSGTNVIVAVAIIANSPILMAVLSSGQTRLAFSSRKTHGRRWYRNRT